MDRRLLTQLDWLDQDEARRRSLLIEQHTLAHGAPPTEAQLSHAMTLVATEAMTPADQPATVNPLWSMGAAVLGGLGTALGWGWLHAHGGLAPDAAVSEVPLCGGLALAALTSAAGCAWQATRRVVFQRPTWFKRCGWGLGLGLAALTGVTAADPIALALRQQAYEMMPTVVRYQMFRLSTDTALAIEPGKDWLAMAPLTPAAPECQAAVHQLDLLAQQPLDGYGLSLQMGAEEAVFRRGCVLSADFFARTDALSARDAAQRSVESQLPFVSVVPDPIQVTTRTWCQLSPEWPAGTPDATVRRACMGPHGEAPEGPVLHHAVPLNTVLAR